MKKTVIIGNVGQDAQLKQTQAGKQYLAFTVAVTEKVGQQETTTWFSCTGWGERFTGAIGQYIKKGGKVYIEGNYSPRLFQRQDGTMDISHDLMIGQIELLSSVQQQAAQPIAQPMAQQPTQQPAGQWGSPGVSAQNPGPSVAYGATAQQPVQQPIQQPMNTSEKIAGWNNGTAPAPQGWTPGSGHKDDNVPF